MRASLFFVILVIFGSFVKCKNYSLCCCECCKDCFKEEKEEEKEEENKEENKEEEKEEENKEENKEEEKEENEKIGDFLENLSKCRYDKNFIKNVTTSKYFTVEQPNVPFFSGYHTVAHVVIPFCFELDISYFKRFPTKMQECINKCIKQYGVSKGDLKIFFCYQYLLTKYLVSVGLVDPVDEENYLSSMLLFRPHFFIAKDEMNENNNVRGYCYGEGGSQNFCVIYIEKSKKMPGGIIKSFSVHDGLLSNTKPSIGIKIEETPDDDILIFYSFVLEIEKKIAAMTIHYFKCPNVDIDYGEVSGTSDINTIADAINFAETNNDKKVVDFLNSITKK